jgi:hypothetical protein
LTKAVSHGKNPKRASTKWVEDVRYVQALRVVVEWCGARSLTVQFTGRSGGVLCTDDNEILVSARASPKSQVHIILHECGHYLIGKKESDKRYAMGYAKSSNNNVKRTCLHRLDILEEEFEAWYRAWSLALRIGIMTDDDRPSFDKERILYLKTYVRWAARGPGYESYSNGDQQSDD